MELLLILCTLCTVFTIQGVVSGCSIETHIAIAYRGREYFSHVSSGLNFTDLLHQHEDAFQAGAPYPDAMYPDVCFGGKFHQVAEDSHWSPFLNATISYIRRKYPQPWDTPTQKLVVFLMGIASHQVADVSWHSLGIDQGFLRVMGDINYHGSFSDAHSDGDFGGDVFNLFELQLDFIGQEDKWYVPIEDLVNIYHDLYGNNTVNATIIENCTELLFLQRIAEIVGGIDLLYALYGEKSTFFMDRLNDYYLGGMDDMAVWTGNLWHRTIDMMETGTEVCNITENPIYIRCGEDKNLELARAVKLDKKAHWKLNQKVAMGRQKVLKWMIRKFDVSLSDVKILRQDRGMYIKPGKKLKQLLAHYRKKSNKRKRTRFMKKESRKMTEEMHQRHELKQKVPDIYYNTIISYSRLGHHMVSGDVNNDGYDDLIVSAPGYSTHNNYMQGAVYIVHGTKDGLPSKNLSLELDSNQILVGPKPNGRFGMSLAVLDINADGLNDLAVSAPSIGSSDLTYQGEIFIFLGQSNARLSPKPSVIMSCTQRYCNLGWSLTSGDFNADGFSDLVVGAPFAPSGGAQRGFVGVFYSNHIYTRGRNLTEHDFNWMYKGKQNYSWVGYSISVIKGGNNNIWLAVGAPTFKLCAVKNCSFDQSDVQAVGKTYLFENPLSSQPHREISGDQEFAQLGFSVTGGLFNVKDVIAVTSSSRSLSSQSIQVGQVSFFDLNANQPAFKILNGDSDFSRFGTSVLFAGDDSIIVTAPFRSDLLINEAEAGAAFVFNSTSTDPLMISSEESQARFGYSAVMVGRDLVFGVPHSNMGGRLSGRVAVVKGK